MPEIDASTNVRSASSLSVDVEQATRDRYAQASSQVETELCCANDGYPAELLDNVPAAIRQIDYGCGDPTRWAQPGDRVLDLGSGSGKHCYLLAQLVGSEGKVVGVDFNPPMLQLARSGLDEFTATTGLSNVEFVKGRIQDLALNLESVDTWLADNPVADTVSMATLEAELDRLRCTTPLIATDSIDLIVSNCVLNLARDQEKPALFAEMFRVLRRGGRCVISDIVSDEEVPENLKNDSQLWSGCISGAMTETGFLRAFERAGFHGIEIFERNEQPWQTVEGIEFRSVTVRAFQGKQGPCIEKNQAVIYRGPWKQVHDDDGHVYPRGERVAVCEKTLGILTGETYRDHIFAVEPLQPVDDQQTQPFDCSRTILRHPRETKGLDYQVTTDPCATCGPGSDCC